MGSPYLWFYDLEIANLDAAGGKIGDLEFDADRTLAFAPLGATHASSKPTRHPASVLIIPFHGR